METRPLGRQLHEDRHRRHRPSFAALHRADPRLPAVPSRTRRRSREPSEALDEQRRRDRVREIRNELDGGGRRSPERSGASPNTSTTFAASAIRARRWSSSAGRLDSVDRRDPLGEVPREHAKAGANLEHHVGLLERSEALDDAEDVLVDEMLSQLTVQDDGETGHASANARSGVLVDLSGERSRILATDVRERSNDVDDVCRLIRAAPELLGREERAVGLGEQAVGPAPGLRQDATRPPSDTSRCLRTRCSSRARGSRQHGDR